MRMILYQCVTQVYPVTHNGYKLHMHVNDLPHTGNHTSTRRQPYPHVCICITLHLSSIVYGTQWVGEKWIWWLMLDLTIYIYKSKNPHPAYFLAPRSRKSLQLGTPKLYHLIVY